MNFLKQAVKKKPAKMKRPGMTLSARFTAASMDPISLALDAKAPASTNIQIIIRTLGFAAPEEKTAMRPSMQPDPVTATA